MGIKCCSHEHYQQQSKEWQELRASCLRKGKTLNDILWPTLDLPFSPLFSHIVMLEIQ